MLKTDRQKQLGTVNRTGADKKPKGRQTRWAKEIHNTLETQGDRELSREGQADRERDRLAGRTRNVTDREAGKISGRLQISEKKGEREKERGGQIKKTPR